MCWSSPIYTEPRGFCAWTDPEASRPTWLCARRTFLPPVWFVTLLWVVNELWGVGVVDLSTVSSVIDFLQESDCVWCIFGLCMTVTRSGGVFMLQSDRQGKRCCVIASQRHFFCQWVDMKTHRREGTSACLIIALSSNVTDHQFVSFHSSWQSLYDQRSILYEILNCFPAFKKYCYL